MEFGFYTSYLHTLLAVILATAFSASRELVSWSLTSLFTASREATTKQKPSH